MYRDRPKWAGWASFALAVLMILALAPAFTQFFAANAKEDYSRMPKMSYSEIFSEGIALSEIKAGVYNEGYAAKLGTPGDYYRVAIREHRLEAAERRFEHEHPDQASTTEYKQLVLRYSLNDLLQVQARYDQRYGHEVMAETAQQMRPWMDANDPLLQYRTLPGAYDGIGEKFRWGYGVAALLAVLFYMARLKQSGLLIWPELVNGRLFAASLSIFALAFVYPKKINPIAQAKRAWQLVSGLFVGVLTFSAMAATAQAGERKFGNADGDSSNVFVMSDLPMPKISGGVGVMSAKVTLNGTRVHDGAVNWADLSATFANGLSFDLWSSRQQRGHGSDEMDYTGCKAGKVGTTDLVGCLSLFDIGPEGSARGGDIVSPSVNASWLVLPGVTAYAKADGYFMTGGPTGQNGYDLIAGLKGSTQFKWVTFSHGASVIYAEGPFGQKPGVSGRIDEEAAVPLTKRVTAFIAGKLLVPFAGAKDRGPDLSGNMGVRIAFN